jgi:hypothetical protein
MKVKAGRAQDLADAARMLGAASQVRRQDTRDLFRRWFPDALEDLESFITRVVWRWRPEQHCTMERSQD